ncbi:hypothetical protein PGT21_022210 [Puccinia graminis f. sp. tritici]|uniref:Uncharacterized protein n=1 Tax=Puccinia graminis f. sp. tritici TaxID=56615 RepID=A0A5B0M4I8_PUCGR|nr:hypothetical protein PGT21_022210 [Puccinia graminis f. sp. tritici]
MKNSRTTRLYLIQIHRLNQSINNRASFWKISHLTDQILTTTRTNDQRTFEQVPQYPSTKHATPRKLQRSLTIPNQKSSTTFLDP